MLALRAADRDRPLFGSLLDRRRHVRAASSTALGWRMATELGAPDSSWSLALEGLALQFVAAMSRVSVEPAGAWLATVRELLHDRSPEQVSLGELAAAVGRHPTHIARAFRKEYGVSVGEYARRLRLDWATTRLACHELPLARLAAEAGFADQSHFTRAFSRHTGLTPGRYRRLLERN